MPLANNNKKLLRPSNMKIKWQNFIEFEREFD